VGCLAATPGPIDHRSQSPCGALSTPLEGGEDSAPSADPLDTSFQPTDTTGWDRALSTATAPGGEVARGRQQPPRPGVLPGPPVTADRRGNERQAAITCSGHGMRGQMKGP
jgi:hypothetical protein